MSALITFLTQHKRIKTKPHSHTWFGSNTTQTLSIPATEVPKLHKLLVADSQTTPVPSIDSPRCITEKITRGVPFRFFADLDFKASSLAKWRQKNHLEVDFQVKLQQKLRSLVQLYHKMVSKAANTEDLEMILSTRLPYKIHLHFPSIIVDTDSAKAIAEMFAARFQEEHADLYEENVVDTSVYTTGLRLLYCHKGRMTTNAKIESERQEHERLFSNTEHYSDVYFITDIDTWTQNKVPSLADISLTSIQSTKEAVLTPLNTETEREKRNKKGKGKRRVSQETDETLFNEVADVRLDAASQILLRFLANESTIPQSEIQVDKWTARGTSLLIPTRSRVCPIAKREHCSNQQYFVVTRQNAEQRCHDEQCPDAVRYKFASELVKAAVADLFGAISGGSSDSADIVELRTDDDRLSAFRGVITEPIGTKTDSAKMNLATANEKMTPMGYWTCTLPMNRYCPVCRSTHDRPENFMQVSPLGHRGIGCNLRHGEFYPDPLSTIPAATINILFNNTINVNVNTTNSVENRDFGSYDQFPHLYDDDDINMCFQSLSGRTIDVALFLAKTVKGWQQLLDSLID